MTHYFRKPKCLFLWVFCFLKCPHKSLLSVSLYIVANALESSTPCFYAYGEALHGMIVVILPFNSALGAAYFRSAPLLHHYPTHNNLIKNSFSFLGDVFKLSFPFQTSMVDFES